MRYVHMWSQRETEIIPQASSYKRVKEECIVVKVAIREMKQWLHNVRAFMLKFTLSLKHPHWNACFCRFLVLFV